MERPPGGAEQQARAQRSKASQKARQRCASPAQFLAQRTREEVDQKQWHKHAWIRDEAWWSLPEERAAADCEQHGGNW